MITFKEEFINKYIERLAHKLKQELEDRLPDKDYFANMVEKANEALKDIVKLNG